MKAEKGVGSWVGEAFFFSFLFFFLFSPCFCQKKEKKNLSRGLRTTPSTPKK